MSTERIQERLKSRGLLLSQLGDVADDECWLIQGQRRRRNSSPRTMAFSAWWSIGLPANYGVSSSCKHRLCVNPRHIINRRAHVSRREVAAADNAKPRVGLYHVDEWRKAFDRAVVPGHFHWIINRSAASDPESTAVVRCRGERIATTRVAWMLHRDLNLNPAHDIRSACGEEDCVNPDHLYLPRDLATIRYDADGLTVPTLVSMDRLLDKPTLGSVKVVPEGRTWRIWDGERLRGYYDTQAEAGRAALAVACSAAMR